jgi:hypothetical protein
MHQLCAGCARLPPFKYSGLVADCVVVGIYFAFVEMEQKDEITACGAYLGLQERKKILGSSVVENKR